MKIKQGAFGELSKVFSFYGHGEKHQLSRNKFIFI